MRLENLIKHRDSLPSLPRAVALALRELDEPDPDLRRIGGLLQQDPMLTARMLALANSARFNLRRGVTTVAEALPLLGLHELRDLLYAAALVGAFQDVGGMQLPEFWRYSLNTARLARRMAKGSPLAVTAYSAGLLHAVGELVLHADVPMAMATLDAQVPLYGLDRAQVESEALGYTYADVGAAFARIWGLPQPLVDAMEQHVNPVDGCEPLVALVHAAAWRARIEMLQFDAALVQGRTPSRVLARLGLDEAAVLAADVVDWVTTQDLSVLS